MAKKQKNIIKKKTARTLIPTTYFVPFFTGDFIPIPPAISHFRPTSLERAIIPRIHFEPIIRG